MQRLCAVLMFVLPSPLRRLVATRILRWEIHPTAHLGRSFILAGHVSMGPGSSIGGRNVIRGLEELRLGEGASIATRNFISGLPLSSPVLPDAKGRNPVLILGRHAMITVAHEIDCSDRVELADYARIAGFRCQVLTHSLDLVRDRYVTGPVEVGERSAVMSGSMLLSGTRLPARSILSAGSVVTTKLTQEQTFYRGNPAEAVRELPRNLKYFKRGEDVADAQ
jgi:acetyltransferase-like isoleucine patch superfamily enzyme